MTSNKNYIEEAKKYFQIAVDEILKSKKNGDIKYAVNGCEKGWLAFNIALDAYFLKNGIDVKELPKNHRRKKMLLKKFADDDLRNLYYRAMAVLHIFGFYERNPEFDEVDETLDDIKNLIDKL